MYNKISKQYLETQGLVHHELTASNEDEAELLKALYTLLPGGDGSKLYVTYRSFKDVELTQLASLGLAVHVRR